MYLLFCLIAASSPLDSKHGQANLAPMIQQRSFAHVTRSTLWHEHLVGTLGTLALAEIACSFLKQSGSQDYSTSFEVAAWPLVLAQGLFADLTHLGQLVVEDKWLLSRAADCSLKIFPAICLRCVCVCLRLEVATGCAGVMTQGETGSGKGSG